jgi:hypothetical protein
MGYSAAAAAFYGSGSSSPNRSITSGALHDRIRRRFGRWSVVGLS